VCLQQTFIDAAAAGGGAADDDDVIDAQRLRVFGTVLNFNGTSALLRNNTP